MNSTDDDEFSQTAFYHEREAAILQLLKPACLIRPPLQCLADRAVYDFTNAIYYAGCVAGSFGIPLESESVSPHLRLLYRNTTRDHWPEISRILSEMYARAYAGYLVRLRAGLTDKQRWTSSSQEIPDPPPPSAKKTIPVAPASANPPTRRSRKPVLTVLKRS